MTILRYINKGYCYFGSGGALGFDLLAAQTILELRQQYPHIKLIMVLPCKTQTKFWMQDDIEAHNHILISADKVVHVSKDYTKNCMYKRNRYLVSNSSLCICYLTNQASGTAYTVRYAQKLNLNIINIANLF